MKKDRTIQIVFAPSEIGAGTRGSSLGPESIKIASWDFKSDFFIKHPILEIPTKNNTIYNSIKFPYAKRIAEIIEVCQNLSKSVEEIITKKKLPVVISGDHSLAKGTIAGIQNAKKNGQLGLIWIDAHADLHTPYTTPSGNVHGMSLAASLMLDNAKYKVRPIDESIKKLWENYKNLSQSKTKINSSDVIILSLRDYEPEEMEIIKQLKINVITTNELRKNGVEFTTRKIFKTLQNCTDIYISLDVDSLDSSISKGTGTPCSNGLKTKEMEDLITKLMENEKIACFEITEINPTLDNENIMAEIAFNILRRGVNSYLLN